MSYAILVMWQCLGGPGVGLSSSLVEPDPAISFLLCDCVVRWWTGRRAGWRKGRRFSVVENNEQEFQQAPRSLDWWRFHRRKCVSKSCVTFWVPRKAGWRSSLRRGWGLSDHGTLLDLGKFLRTSATWNMTDGVNLSKGMAVGKDHPSYLFSLFFFSVF